METRQLPKLLALAQLPMPEIENQELLPRELPGAWLLDAVPELGLDIGCPEMLEIMLQVLRCQVWGLRFRMWCGFGSVFCFCGMHSSR